MTFAVFRRHFCALTLVGLALGVRLVAADDLADDLIARGEQIYNDTCLDCHGEQGAGVAGAYEQPLIGDASIGELTQIIAETMPQGDPQSCAGEQAAAVSAYIHELFYGEAAQLRRRPPRAVLQRLTGTQMRQSLTDLYAVNDQTLGTKWGELQAKQGLEASYFAGPRWKKENLKIERIDPVLDFRWGHQSPGGGIEPKEFYVHWEGGLRVPQTGRYEIVATSDCSFELQFGDRQDKLIDNHVQSEGLTEFRRHVTLTGGRVYPIWIDLHQSKRKTEQPPANFTLSWVRPGGVREIIPASHLVAGWAPSVLRLETQFPPDDRSYGFERGLSIDAAWDDAVTAAAFELADRLTSQQWQGYARGAEKKGKDRGQALRDFLTPLVAAAQRAPRDSVGPFLDKAAAGLVDEKEIIKRTVLMAVKSPRFLYPQLDLDRSTSQQVMDRLHLVLHDSLPTQSPVLQEIQQGHFESPDSIDWVIDQMIDDARLRSKMRDLFTQWLELDKHGDLRKSEERFGGFGPEVIADLHGSLETFLDATLWSDTSDWRQLVLADSMPTTSRLAQYYGAAWKPTDRRTLPGSGFHQTDQAPGTHVGLITHPLVMSSLSYYEETSPIHRGVFLIRQVMGRTLRPPNAAFTPFDAELHPSLTTRARVELQTGEQNCQVCHRRINGMGFTLENYDATGRFRTAERNQPIDPTGNYLTRTDEVIEFSGARQLAEMIVASPDAQSAFVTRVFQHLVKQPVAAYGSDRLEQLRDEFEASGFNIRSLIKRIAQIVATEPMQPALAGT